MAKPKTPRDANPDPITDEPGAHPVETGVGAALHVFEVRVNSDGQSEESFNRFRKLISLPWRGFVHFIYLSPKPMLLFAQKLKQRLFQVT